VSVRCVALGMLSAVALVGASLPASAGLLDGWWGCGCGGPGYYVGPTFIAPPFVEPAPGIIYPQVQVVVAPPPVVYAPSSAPAVAPLGPAPLLLSRCSIPAQFAPPAGVRREA
jgi:hypothetical protein